MKFKNVLAALALAVPTCTGLAYAASYTLSGGFTCNASNVCVFDPTLPIPAGDNILTFPFNCTGTACTVGTIGITFVSQIPGVTTQPVSATLVSGNAATFTYAFSGLPTPTCQVWKEPSGGGSFSVVTGATSCTSYTTGTLTTANSGDQYYVIATNSAGNVQTNTVSTTVTSATSAPAVTTQPSNATVAVNSTASFTVVFSGSPTPTCQWYKEPAGGSTFTAISGATSCTGYTTVAQSTANNGDKYHVKGTNSAGSATSNDATVTITAPPMVSSQPSNVTVAAGNPATFSVAFTGLPAPTCQWYEEAAGATSFTSMSGKTSCTSLTTGNLSASDNGDQFYVIGTNASGTAQSNTVTATVNSTPALIAFVSDGGYSYSATSPVSMTRGTSPPSGDLMIMQVGVSSTSLTSSITTPTGWTYYTDVNGQLPCTGCVYVYHDYIFYKYSSGSEPTTYNVSGTASSGFAGLDGEIRVYKNTAPSNPFNSFKSANATSGIGSGETITVPALSETFATGEMYVGIFNSFNNQALTGSNTAATLSDVYSNAGSNVSVVIGDYLPTSTPGTEVWDGITSNSLGDNIAIGLSILPASGGTGGIVIAAGQPTDQSGVVGGTATFTVSVTGTTSCQWQKNGTNISGATSCSSFTYPTSGTLVAGDNGATFDLVAGGTVTSRVATLTVTSTAPSTAYDQWGLPNTPVQANIAVPAEAWLQSIGMDIWPFNNGATEGGASQTATMLEYVGARWVRGSGGPTKDPNDAYFQTVANTINTAYPNTHFKYVYLLFSGCYSDSDFAGGNNPPAGNELYNIVQLYNKGLLKYIENGNEPANDYICWNGTSYGGAAVGYGPPKGSWNGITQMQAAVHAAIASNSTIAGRVGLSTPNYVGAAWDNSGLEWGTAMPNPQPPGLSQNSPGPSPAGTVWADYLSVHNYPQTTVGWQANDEWDTSRRRVPSHESFYEDFCQGNYPLPCNATNQNIQAQKPGVATEGGIWGGTFDAATPQCHILTDNHTQQNVYLIDKYIEGFTGCGDATGGSASCDKGISAASYYNLVDGDGGYCGATGVFQGPGGPVGDVPYTAWPAATTMHNATTILNDSGTNFVPGVVNWTISGCPTGGNANQSTCHGLLLQKANGHYWLLQTYDWDGSTSTSVTVNFGQMFSHVNVYDPTVGTSVISGGSLTNQSSYTYTNNTGAPRFFELY